MASDPKTGKQAFAIPQRRHGVPPPKPATRTSSADLNKSTVTEAAALSQKASAPPRKATMMGLPPPPLPLPQQPAPFAAQGPPPPPSGRVGTTNASAPPSRREAEPVSVSARSAATADVSSPSAPHVTPAHAAASVIPRFVMRTQTFDSRASSAQVPEAISVAADRSTPEDPRAYDVTTGIAFARTISASAGIVAPPPPDPTPAPLPMISAPVEPKPIQPIAEHLPPLLTRRRRRIGSRLLVAGASLSIAGLALAALLVLPGEELKQAPPASQLKQQASQEVRTGEPATKPDPAKPRTRVLDERPAPGVPKGVTASTGVPINDGSGSKAPSCEQLLGNTFGPKVDPDAAYDQARLANRELVRGNVDASQTAFCKAALWDATNINTMLSLAQLLLIRRDGEMAAEWVQNALKRDPYNPRALILLGDALVRVGRTEAARKAWLDAEKIAENDQTRLALMVQRDLEEARRTFKRRDYARAERLFRRVVAFDSEHAAASAGLAGCLARLGNADAAELWARRAEALKSDVASIQVTLGDVRAAHGNHEAARTHWRRALELDPNSRDAARRLK